jgi:hypothetical protein
MVVNQNHVQALLSQVDNDAPPAKLRDLAGQYEDYVSRGKTLRDPDTGENVSIDSLAEMARVLRAAADALERGEVKDMEEAWQRGFTPAPSTSGGAVGARHEGRS